MHFRLTDKLKSRKEEQFLSIKVKSKLRKLEADGEIIVAQFLNTTDSFYETAIDYLNLWRASFGPFEQFTWTNLRTGPVWSDVERCLETFTSVCVPIGIQLDNSCLFDEITNVRNFVSADKLKQWENASIKLTIADKWIEIFKFFRDQSMTLSSLELLVEFVLAIPGTNAHVERVFSLMKHYWGDEKSRLEVATVKAAIITKFNATETCTEMYDKLIQNKKLLQKIHSSEKYGESIIGN